MWDRSAKRLALVEFCALSEKDFIFCDTCVNALVVKLDVSIFTFSLEVATSTPPVVYSKCSNIQCTGGALSHRARDFGVPVLPTKGFTKTKSWAGNLARRKHASFEDLGVLCVYMVQKLCAGAARRA